MANHETTRQALEQRELWPLFAFLLGGALFGVLVDLALVWRGRRWIWAFAGVPLTCVLILLDPWLAFACGIATAIAVLFGVFSWVSKRFGSRPSRGTQSSAEEADPFLISPGRGDPQL